MKTSILKNITVLVRNNNTYDTIYEWYSYDAGCFKAYAFFFTDYYCTTSAPICPNPGFKYRQMTIDD